MAPAPTGGHHNALGHAFMTGLGSGYAPVASGTVGSAVAVGIALAIWWVVSLAGGDAWRLDAAWLILTLLASVGCVVWGPWAVERFSGSARKEGDPGQVVLDEWAGQWIALIALPMATFSQALTVLAVQFFFFRLFDVLKPPPARQCEKFPAGWGILTDDLVAGVYANLVGQGIFRLLLS
ncbi:MAG: phosphatidylglycerophosphatase A [Phycisphaerae bacterium]|nr:phosphatidylglycerophosphatase A [Phycisphaerae bacterium]